MKKASIPNMEGGKSTVEISTAPSHPYVLDHLKHGVLRFGCAYMLISSRLSLKGHLPACNARKQYYGR
ncbi:uncharacterized protein CTRU02_205601 [Colletotrichum truncatum]|uniref:Uncharacterized protein n=1 Tax=Colletotrichum truncatum TaxID=5467 RepID=A0ACC3Z4H1_COLTU